MNKTAKKLALYLLSASACACAIVGASCATNSKPQFLEGIDTELELGDSLLLIDYIDYVTDGDYTITVSKGDFSENITKKRYWQPEEPGTYTVTYTVHSGAFKGTNSFDLVVNVPLMSWDYTLVNTIYDTGSTIEFDAYFEEMNISALSYYPWKMVMESVTVGNDTIDVTEQDSWTFEQATPHVFKFHIESEDGQMFSLSQKINVRYVVQDMLEWMEANDVTVDRALRLESGQKIVLDAGTNQGALNTYPDQSPNKSLPYVAFNGEYGVNDFLVFDFTGNNLPNMLFFADEMNDTLWNNECGANNQKGFVLSGGWTKNNGQPYEAWQTETSINARFKIYGPNKILKVDDGVNGQIRSMFSLRPNPFSMYTLAQEQNANVKYRAIIGFIEATETQFTVAAYLMNRETGDTIYSATKTISNTDIYGYGDGSILFTEDLFKGKIGLYGAFGKELVLDKIYPIEQDTTLQALKVKYLESPYQWMKEGKVTSSGVVSSNEAQQVVLKASSYVQDEGVPADYGREIDMSYIAFNGDYGLNDFLVLEFTGNNMPYISFFNKEVNNSVFNAYDNTKVDGEEVFNETAKEEKGLVLSNGQMDMNGNPFAPWNKTGSVNDRLTLAGPYKANKFGASDLGWFRNNLAGAGTPMGVFTLSKAENANTKYRMFVGFTQGDTTGCTMVMYVTNRDTGAVVCHYEQQFKEEFSENYFTGSIALHGQFGKQTAFKVYPIQQDTTLSYLKAKFTQVSI